MDHEAHPIELALLALLLVAEALAVLVAAVLVLGMAITQAKAQPLAAHGTNQHREEEDPGGSVTTSSKDRGQTYLLRRLARDQPRQC